MIDKLKEAERKFISIEEKLQEPGIFADQEKFAALMKEYKTLSPVIEKFREYNRQLAHVEEAKQVLEETGDPEMKELASSELKEGKVRVEALKDGKVSSAARPERDRTL